MEIGLGFALTDPMPIVALLGLVVKELKLVIDDVNFTLGLESGYKLELDPWLVRTGGVGFGVDVDRAPEAFKIGCVGCY